MCPRKSRLSKFELLQFFCYTPSINTLNACRGFMLRVYVFVLQKQEGKKDCCGKQLFSFQMQKHA